MLDEQIIQAYKFYPFEMFLDGDYAHEKQLSAKLTLTVYKCQLKIDRKGHLWCYRIVYFFISLNQNMFEKRYITLRPCRHACASAVLGF